ncbi:tail assembly chaperone [Arthrobacter phage KBurrousTX]|uniref:Uncharacterized protein n=1 Tax=Arthrobacter phage KBurrousTX TaxID=2315608 RepID=A0A386KB09_9CAUD|nr:tail assembly chaperone [Arthrobacter phage KBurrousTX]AYD81514.1 hypothetical protein KBurrousTX_20 [Arthrobacter phage KBurrousTX]
MTEAVETTYGTIPAAAGAHAAAPEPQRAAYFAESTPEAPAPVEREESPLDVLRAEAKRELERFVTYKVEGREGFAVKFSTVLEPEDIKRYGKNAQGRKKDPKDADQIIAAGQPLVENNRAILQNGKIVVASDGEDLTFQHKEFIELFGESLGAVHAVRKFLGPGQLLSMGGELFAEAGYGSDVESVDPQRP